MKRLSILLIYTVLLARLDTFNIVLSIGGSAHPFVGQVRVLCPR